MSTNAHSAGNEFAKCLMLVAAGVWAVLGFAPQSHADCPVEPTGAIEIEVASWPALGSPAQAQAATAIDGQGRFIVAWDDYGFGADDIYVKRYLPDGQPVFGATLLSGDEASRYAGPSVAVSRSGQVRAGWQGNCDCHPARESAVVVSDFEFFETPELVALPLAPPYTTSEEASVGVSDVGVGAVAYQTMDIQDPDLCEVRFRIGSDPQPITIASNELCAYVAPCLAMRSDGHFCLVWAKQGPGDPPDFDVVVQLYAPNGTLIDERAGPDEWANDPSAEVPGSGQHSPAVAFDDAGNIVVVWFGPPNGQGAGRVWARRFHWAGGANDPIAPLSDAFIVDSRLDLGLNEPALGYDSHPTASLTLDLTHTGRFLVAWNASRPFLGDYIHEVHGQYFEADGRPLGCEFRVNQDASPIGSCVRTERLLPPSARHTVSYGPADQAAAVWTAYGVDPPCYAGTPNYSIHCTLLPGGYADALDQEASCLKGDVNRDGLIDGLDIRWFVDYALRGPGSLSIVILCPADIDANGNVDVFDIPGFVDLLLSA